MLGRHENLAKAGAELLTLPTRNDSILDGKLALLWKYAQRSVLLVFSALVLSCKPYRSEVDVDVDARSQFHITVRNRAEESLVIDDRVLGLGIDTPIKLEVADQGGAVIQPCSHLDYVAPRKPVSVAPGGEVVVSIPVSAITLTYCLPVNQRFKIRAVLVSGNEVVAHSTWVPFRAVSPMEETIE